jgi:hypothetical protein
MTTEGNAAPTTQSVSIRNRYVLVGSILAAGAGLGYFVLKPNAPAGWLTIALSVACMWIFVLEFQGVVAAPGTLTFAHRPRWLPIFPIWRSRILLDQLDEMTLLHRWCGFQVVRLVGQFGSERLLFDSRKARLIFFAAVKAQRPNIPIYRVE